MTCRLLVSRTRFGLRSEPEAEQVRRAAGLARCAQDGGGERVADRILVLRRDIAAGEGRTAETDHDESVKLMVGGETTAA